jgi:hypothetical protein
MVISGSSTGGHASGGSVHAVAGPIYNVITVISVIFFTAAVLSVFIDDAISGVLHGIYPEREIHAPEIASI